MERIPKPGEFYRHFKNKLYQVMAVAEHTETGEKLVIYQALYGDFKIYARPLSMFVSPVDREKYPDAEQEYRFEKTEPGAAKDGQTEKGWLQQAQAGGRASEKAEEEKTEEEAGGITFLIDFLDAETPEEKLGILKKKGGQASLRQLDMLCEALEIPSGNMDRESSLEAIRKYLETMMKYDGSRLRR